MVYTLFIDKEQLQFLGSLEQNRIVKAAVERFGMERPNLYYAEFRGFDLFEIILELKRLDRTTVLYQRFKELANLQDDRFEPDFKKYCELREDPKLN